MTKIRVDKLIFERGLATSREKAAALIMAGCVFSGDKKILKPGQMVAPDLELNVKGEDHPYVGRGGMKLARAIDEFGIEVKGKVCMDVGASTGGFTDCLLQKGAKFVYAIDVGYGQLAWKIAKDDRVEVIERTNIRHMPKEKIADEIDVVVIDVSFISLDIVLSSIVKFLAKDGIVIALIKPQFEVGKDLVGKGGIVRDPKAHEFAIEKVKSAGKAIGLEFKGLTESPILGTKGNKEFLIYFGSIST